MEKIPVLDEKALNKIIELTNAAYGTSFKAGTKEPKETYTLSDKAVNISIPEIPDK